MTPLDPEIKEPTQFSYDVTRGGLKEIERAKRLGTFGKTDRTKQYEGRYSPEMLLKSQNHLWARLRSRDQQKFRNAVILVVLSAGLARAPELVALGLALLRWIGLLSF